MRPEFVRGSDLKLEEHERRLAALEERWADLERRTETQLRDIERRLKVVEAASSRFWPEAEVSKPRDYGTCSKPGSSWSKEVPKESGFYWIRFAEDAQRPWVCHYDQAELLKRSRDEYDGREWYGPIEPPE